MKRLIMLIFFTASTVLLLACTRGTEAPDTSIPEASAEAPAVVPEAIPGIPEAAETVMEQNIFSPANEARFVNYNSFGTVYNTVVKSSLADLYRLPSAQSEILLVMPGNTEINVLGISGDGLWLLIRIREGQENEWSEGWVLGENVFDETPRPREITIRGLSPEEPRRARSLYGTYMEGNREIAFTVYPNKLGHQDFWTFVWDIYNDNYRYDTVPGSYVWYPETNELRHISYMGTSMESAWSIFTDDFKYILQDFGTSPGVRGLAISRVDDGERVYSGGYLDLRLRGYIIETVYSITPWSRPRLDEEILAFAEDFMSENPEPAEMRQYSRETGLGIELIIVCELDFDTGTRTILRGEYIYVQ